MSVKANYPKVNDETGKARYFVEEREIFEEIFHVEKEYCQSPPSIRYIMCWGSYEEFNCLLRFNGTEHDYDVCFILEYMSAEEAFVDAIFNQLIRSLVLFYKHDLMHMAINEMPRKMFLEKMRRIDEDENDCTDKQTDD